MAALARLGLLSTIFLFVSANNVYYLPARTVRTDDGYAASGWTPKPTEKPSRKELFKRQTNGLQAGFPSSICGYIASDTSKWTLWMRATSAIGMLTASRQPISLYRRELLWYRDRIGLLRMLFDLYSDDSRQHRLIHSFGLQLFPDSLLGFYCK